MFSCSTDEIIHYWYCYRSTVQWISITNKNNNWYCITRWAAIFVQMMTGFSGVRLRVYHILIVKCNWYIYLPGITRTTSPTSSAYYVHNEWIPWNTMRLISIRWDEIMMVPWVVRATARSLLHITTTLTTFITQPNVTHVIIRFVHKHSLQNKF